MNRQTLKTGYDSCAQVLTEIDNFHLEFRQKFNKAAKTQLVYSSAGVKNEERHELAIWFAKGDEREVEFFVGLAGK